MSNSLSWNYSIPTYRRILIGIKSRRLFLLYDIDVSVILLQHFVGLQIVIARILGNLPLPWPPALNLHFEREAEKGPYQNDPGKDRKAF